MSSIAFMTLGCKVNQYETALLKENLKNNYTIVDAEGKADIYIVNTCTVTSRSDQKSRQYIRRILVKNPKAEVIITGCYAHLFPDEIKAISKRCVVFNNKRKQRILDYLGIEGEKQTSKITRFDEHTRAFIKIQDGCNSFCAYCSVPYARTQIYSKPVEEIIDEIEGLLANGYKEIVICGINLGRYQYKSLNLSNLLKIISKIEGLQRFRLSSLEPDTIDENLIKTLSELPNFCRFLHIPLQSGDDHILKLMGRRYNLRSFLLIVDRLRELMPDIGLSSDIIVGFSGEDNSSFKKTYNFIQNVRFSRLHIFRFSERPGTNASNLDGKLTAITIKERACKLALLEKRLRKEFHKKFLNKEVDVLFEKREPIIKTRFFVKDNLISGLSRNYIKIIAEGCKKYINECVPVKIFSVSDKYCLGNII